MEEEATKRGVTFEVVLQQKLEALEETGVTGPPGFMGGAASAGGGGPAAAGSAGPGQPPTGMPRFKLGDNVMCKIGMDGDNWMKGRIVSIGYREAHFPAGYIAPYQIQLVSGQLIYAPYDRDDIIRRDDCGDARWYLHPLPPTASHFLSSCFSPLSSSSGSRTFLPKANVCTKPLWISVFVLCYTFGGMLGGGSHLTAVIYGCLSTTARSSHHSYCFLISFYGHTPVPMTMESSVSKRARLTFPRAKPPSCGSVSATKYLHV